VEVLLYQAEAPLHRAEVRLFRVEVRPYQVVQPRLVLGVRNLLALGAHSLLPAAEASQKQAAGLEAQALSKAAVGGHQAEHLPAHLVDMIMVLVVRLADTMREGSRHRHLEVVGRCGLYE
jgi:hypothetical protein